MNGDGTVEHIAARDAPRLDAYLASELSERSRNAFQHLIAAGHVLVDGRSARASQPLHAGQHIRIEVPLVRPLTLTAEAIPLVIVYEDADLLVLDKPAGIAVHPGPGHPEGTLVNALLAHDPDLPGILGVQRPGIVHRLDKDTSGLLVVAKSERGQTGLARQFAERRVHKGYLALVQGELVQPVGVIDAPLARDSRQRQRMAIMAGGRHARTRFQRLGRAGAATFLLALPETGRTHQIRLHFAAIGHPLVGDRLYGGESTWLERQFLHAFALRFAHPLSGNALQFFAPLPEELYTLLERLVEADGATPDAAQVEVERMLRWAQERYVADGEAHDTED